VPLVASPKLPIKFPVLHNFETFYQGQGLCRSIAPGPVGRRSLPICPINLKQIRFHSISRPELIQQKCNFKREEASASNQSISCRVTTTGALSPVGPESFKLRDGVCSGAHGHTRQKTDRTVLIDNIGDIPDLDVSSLGWQVASDRSAFRATGNSRFSEHVVCWFKRICS
jgi:hypothetical protein